MNGIKNGISDKYYYELLVWKDDNPNLFKTIVSIFNVDYISLVQLTKNELERLYFLIFNKYIGDIKQEYENYKFEIIQPVFNRSVIIKDDKENILYQTGSHHPESDIYLEYNNENYLILKTNSKVYKLIK